MPKLNETQIANGRAILERWHGHSALEVIREKLERAIAGGVVVWPAAAMRALDVPDVHVNVLSLIPEMIRDGVTADYRRQVSGSIKARLARYHDK